MVSFSIYDYDNPIPDHGFVETSSKELQVQPAKQSSSHHELTAAQTNTQTEKYFSIYDTISFV